MLSDSIPPNSFGEVVSCFQWVGAGIYRRMHEQLFFVSDLPYGSDGHNLFPRLDIVENRIFTLEGTELRINVKTAETSHSFPVELTQNRKGSKGPKARFGSCALRWRRQEFRRATR